PRLHGSQSSPLLPGSHGRVTQAQVPNKQPGDRQQTGVLAPRGAGPVSLCRGACPGLQGRPTCSSFLTVMTDTTGPKREVVQDSSRGTSPLEEAQVGPHVGPQSASLQGVAPVSCKALLPSLALAMVGALGCREPCAVPDVGFPDAHGRIVPLDLACNP